MNKGGFLSLLRDLVTESALDEQKKADLLLFLTEDKFVLITPELVDELNKIVVSALEKKEATVVMGNDPEEIEDYTQMKSKLYEVFNNVDLAFLTEKGVGGGESTGADLLGVYAGLAD